MIDKYFWIAQPSSILNIIDWYFGYLFAGLFLLGVILFLLNRFINHPTFWKLIKKVYLLCLTLGVTGIIWFGFRYEVTPIFSKRFWAGGTVLIGLVWLLFIFKYLIFNFRAEKKEYQEALIKSKYLPRTKTR